ncbi:MAG: hypothetical protein KDK70_01030 [Myxococcales bacterium]|nr:hypothetical protein [Myxococcales bacterium]
MPLGPGHAERVGWSPDGERFTHCHARADGCYECRTVTRGGSAESLESGPGCAEGIAREQLDARLDALAPGPGAARWPWGDQIVLVVETREHEQDNAGRPRPMLKLGARLREGGIPSWTLHVDPCEGCGTDQVCAGQAHLDALSLSPRGDEVVALIHGQGNDGAQRLRLERIPTQRLADAARTPASRAP